MNQEYAERITEAIQSYGDDHGHNVYTDYSGRGAGGRTCVGIVTRNADETTAGILRYLEAEDEGVQEFADVFLRQQSRRDQLGADMILYWPALVA